MPADQAVPLSIGGSPRAEPAGELLVPGDAGDALGRAVAGMLRHLVAVLDREDRLEAGSGEWLHNLAGDGDALAGAVHEAVLRALHLASDTVNFRILGELAHGGAVTRAELARRLALPELSVAERIGDLVSAGLVVKVPEANQINAAPAGTALAGWVAGATRAGARVLQEDGP